VFRRRTSRSEPKSAPGHL